MFVLSLGAPATVNLLKDKPNRWAGASNWGKTSSRKQDGSLSYSNGFTVAETGLRGNVWVYHPGHGYGQSDLSAYKHPAAFPYALAVDHITTWTNSGDVVLDPMVGSGTVLRAAKDLGRVAVGVEIHEDYLPIITGRMAQQVLL